VAAVRDGDGRVVAVSGGTADRSMRIWEIDPEAHRANNRGEPSVEALATPRPARLARGLYTGCDGRPGPNCVPTIGKAIAELSPRSPPTPMTRPWTH
jgi:hypothetical protein